MIRARFVECPCIQDERVRLLKVGRSVRWDMVQYMDGGWGGGGDVEVRTPCFEDEMRVR